MLWATTFRIFVPLGYRAVPTSLIPLLQSYTNIGRGSELTEDFTNEIRNLGIDALRPIPSFFVN